MFVPASVQRVGGSGHPGQRSRDFVSGGFADYTATVPALLTSWMSHALDCWPTRTFRRREGRSGNPGLSGRKIRPRATDFYGGFRNFRGYRGRETQSAARFADCNLWRTGFRPSQQAFPTVEKTRSTPPDLPMMDFLSDTGQQPSGTSMGRCVPWPPRVPQPTRRASRSCKHNRRLHHESQTFPRDRQGVGKYSCRSLRIREFRLARKERIGHQSQVLERLGLFRCGNLVQVRPHDLWVCTGLERRPER